MLPSFLFAAVIPSFRRQPDNKCKAWLCVYPIRLGGICKAVGGVMGSVQRHAQKPHLATFTRLYDCCVFDSPSPFCCACASLVF